MALDLDGKNTYAVYCLDENLRKDSSSGGFFSVLAQKVINNSGLVYGAGFDGDFNVKHMAVSSIEDLSKLRGSKYVQSNIGNCYLEAKKLLENGDEVLFTGTPCQINGLNKFLGKSYDNLLTLDVVCHGVPSPKLWSRYLADKSNNMQINEVSFRDKTTGWKNYTFKIDTDKQKYNTIFNKDAYMQAFLKNYSLRPSCYSCISKENNTSSDFTLGDYWGIEKQGIIHDDDKGVSILFVNSPKGIEILKDLSDRIFIKEISGRVAAEYNPCLYMSVAEPEKRSVFFEKCFNNNMSLEKLVLYCSEGNLIKRTLRKIKNRVIH